jgi:hypothetical protein
MNNIGQSFKFIFEDPKWFIKLFIGGIFTLLSVVLIGIPVIYGYRIELLKRVRRREQYPLPEWKDVVVMFVTGLKYIVTQIIYFLPLLLLLIPFFSIMVFFVVQGTSPKEFFGTTPVLVLSLLGVSMYSLFVLLITPVIAIQFSTQEHIADGLNIGIIIRIFKSCWQNVIIVVVLGIALDILHVLGLSLFSSESHLLLFTSSSFSIIFMDRLPLHYRHPDPTYETSY